jgi:hypothetical protein
MNVLWDGKDVRIEAENNLDYVLANLPGLVADKQQHLPATTPLIIALDVDGIFVRPLTGGKAMVSASDTEEVQKKLKTAPEEFILNSVRVEQIFSVRVKLRFEHTLGECSGDDIVAAIRARLQSLKAAKFKVQGPPSIDE